MVILLLYTKYRRARRPPGVDTENANTTRAIGHGMQTENGLSNGATATDVEDSFRPFPLGDPPPYAPPFLPESNAVCNNGVTVIEVDEDFSALRPGPPPSYSSLDCERQQNVNDEHGQPPPSYDEAVRNSETP